MRAQTMGNGLETSSGPTKVLSNTVCQAGVLPCTSPLCSSCLSLWVKCGVCKPPGIPKALQSVSGKPV